MKNEFDLTEGRILSKLLVIALPIMGTQLFQMLYNIIDMFLLGRISSDALAATGSAGMFLWLSVAFFLIGSMGAEIGVSQNLGKKDIPAAKRFAENAGFLAIVLGIFYGLAMILFAEPLIRFLQVQDPAVVRDGANYLWIVSLSTPATFLSFALNGAFNGAGNSRYSFLFKGLGLGLNIILSPLFIFTFDMGIQGAAIATTISQFFVCFIFLWAIKFHPSRPFKTFSYRRLFKFCKGTTTQILKWTLPIAIESLCFTVLTMFISQMVAGFGTGAIATHRVGSQIESLSWLIGGGFASALTAYIGQNFGARKWSRIHKGFKASMVIMSVYGVMISLLMFFGARALFSLFITDSDVIPLGVDYLRIFALIQLFECIGALAAGAFRGIGKTQPPSYTSIFFNTLRVGAAFLLSRTQLGLNGIWWGMAICNTLRGLLTFAWYWSSARKQPREDEIFLAGRDQSAAGSLAQT